MNSTLLGLNHWVESHQALIVAVGIPLLVTLVAGVFSWVTTKATLDAQRRHRILEREIKLAEFRQAWMNDLRVDFADYAALHTKASLDFSDADFIEMMKTGSRILMRMNRKDPDFSNIEKSVSHGIDRASTPIDEIEKLNEKYKDAEPIVVIGHRVLKREWERLKSDLIGADA